MSKAHQPMRLIIPMIVCALLCASLAASSADPAVPDVGIEWSGERAVYERQVVGYLTSFFATSNPRHLRRALALVPVVLDVCEETRTNPALVAAMVTLESTWEPASRGKLGELGLMQVNRDDVPEEPSDQLRAGIAILLDAYERCGTTLGAVSLYATGKSCKPYRGARLRLRLAHRIETQF